MDIRGWHNQPILGFEEDRLRQLDGVRQKGGKPGQQDEVKEGSLCDCAGPKSTIRACCARRVLTCGTATITFFEL